MGFDQAFTYAYSRREQTYAGLFYADDVPAEVKARRLGELIDAFQGAAERRSARWEAGRLHLVLVEGRGKRISLARRPRQLQAQRPATAPAAPAATADPAAPATPVTDDDDDDEENDDDAGQGTAAYLGDGSWTGRTDTNKRVVFPTPFPALAGLSRAEAARFAALAVSGGDLRADADAVAALIAEVAAARSGDAAPPDATVSVDKGQYVVVKVLSGRGHTLRAVPVAVVDDLLVAAALDLPNLLATNVD